MTHQRMTVWLPDDVAEAIREAAAENDRKISAEVTRACRAYLSAGQPSNPVGVRPAVGGTPRNPRR